MDLKDIELLDDPEYSTPNDESQNSSRAQNNIGSFVLNNRTMLNKVADNKRKKKSKASIKVRDPEREEDKQ